MRNEDRLQREIAAGLARDLDAHFERFVVTYRDRVFAYTLNLTGDRATADDLAQDVFIAAYRALRGYSPERRRALALRAWLYRIATNRVRNAARAGRKTRTAPLDGTAERAGANPRDEPAAQAERRESARALRAALARLAPRYREPLVLRHIEERSYAEIATILSQPVGTVKANVHRGLAQLRAAYIEGDHHGEGTAAHAR